MKKSLFSILVFGTIILAQSQSEFPVKFYIDSRGQLEQIQKIVEYIEDFDPKTGMVKVYVSDDSYGELNLLGYNPVRLVDTSAINARYAITHPDDVMYHNYSQLTDWVHNLAATYPSIVGIDSLGPSVEGRWLWVIHITDNPDDEEIEPEFVYISTMHGDEPVGTELLMWFCDSLTQKYGTEPRLTRIVDSLDLWVVPMMNPDGNTHTQRYNVDGVDLNRNFPVPDGTIGNDATYTFAPETQAMMDFLSQRRPSFTINFHTGALVANYPWDFDIVRAPDDDLYIRRSTDYSILNSAMYSSPSFPDGITNGYDWYEVNGSMQDWHYHTFDALHITVELNNVKWPSDTELPRIWNENYQSMLRIVELAMTGIHGIVEDSITGQPLDAEIWFDQIDRWANTDPALGDFHRELLAGTYSLTVIADGYYSKRITGITLPTDTSSVFINIQLVRADTIYYSDFESDDGGLTTQSFTYYQDWQWGEPTTGNNFPEYVPSGTKLWGTVLTNNYNDSSQSRLMLNVDLSAYTKASLVFDEWYRFQSVNWSSSDTVAHDGGQIKIATSTDTVAISPYWGYRFVSSEYNWLMNTADSIFADNEPGTPWHKIVIPLDDYCGQAISIFWDFGSSNQNTDVGWYIDNISVVAPGSSVSIAENKLPQQIGIDAYPNPFNSSCRIMWEASPDVDYRGQETSPTIEIYDLRGNIITPYSSRQSRDSFVPLNKEDRGDASALARGVYIWKPDNSIPSGVYLLKVDCGNNNILNKKLILIR
ncbi:DUF2817 domain-containing protein [bacterium]|nr:DUF2817 domain-containing protein [bacterium]